MKKHVLLFLLTAPPYGAFLLIGEYLFRSGVNTALPFFGWLLLLMVLGAAASAEDYVLLAGDFSVTYQGIAAQGAYLPELLGVYAALSEVLGEPRANFVSVSLEASGVASSTRFDRFRFASREGVEIVIWDPASAPAELGKAAAEAYLSLGDAQRVRGNILVQRTASGGVSAEYVSSL